MTCSASSERTSTGAGCHTSSSRTPPATPPRAPAKDDAILAAATATARGYGVSTQTWPMYNGCCPASLFQHLGNGMGFSFAGLGQGERPHAPDEYIHADAVGRLAHFTVDYLHAWAAA